MSRSYTYEEIEKMRRAERVLRMSPTFVWDGVPGHLAHSTVSISDERIESAVRTYMAAGIEPEDLVRRAKEADDRVYAGADFTDPRWAV